MTGAELNLLTNHMGHDHKIHADWYKVQSSILERTKVARIVVAVDNGLEKDVPAGQLAKIKITGNYHITYTCI